MPIGNTPKNYKRFAEVFNKYEKLRKDQFLQLNSKFDVRALYDEILFKDNINENEKDKPDEVIFRKWNIKISSGIRSHSSRSFR